MTRDQVDRIARGRVWSGEDAKGIGLVDQLGGLEQAIGSAAKRAKLPAGYRVVYLEKEKGFSERVADMLLTRTEAADELAPDAAALGPAAFSVTETLRGVQADIARLSRWNDPRGIYAHCLCGGD